MANPLGTLDRNGKFFGLGILAVVAISSAVGAVIGAVSAAATDGDMATGAIEGAILGAAAGLGGGVGFAAARAVGYGVKSAGAIAAGFAAVDQQVAQSVLDRERLRKQSAGENLKEFAAGAGTNFVVDVVGGAVAVRVVGPVVKKVFCWIYRKTSASVPVGTKLRRNWGGDSGPDGESWTRESVSGQTRQSLGLGRSNTGEFISHGTLIDDAGVSARPAQPWDGFSGGGDEVVVPSPATQIDLEAVTMPDIPIQDG